jgi:hypothetical protein
MGVNPTLPVVGQDDGSWGGILNAAQLAVTNEINNHESASDPHGDRAYADSNKLAKTTNLSDLADAPTARTNLGLGSAATQDSTAFATPASVSAAIAAAFATGNIVNL